MKKLVLLLVLSSCQCYHDRIDTKQYSSDFMLEFEKEIKDNNCYKCREMHEDYKYLRTLVEIFNWNKL